MFRGTDDGDPGKRKRADAGLQFSLGASFGPEQTKADDFKLGPEIEVSRQGTLKTPAGGSGEKDG